MSLFTCKECGERISSEASACPNCGAPVQKSSNAGCIWAMVLALLFFVVLLANQNGSRDSSDSRPGSSLIIEGNAYIIKTDGYSVMTTKNWGSTAEAYVSHLVAAVSAGDTLRVRTRDGFGYWVEFNAPSLKAGKSGWTPLETFRGAEVLR